MGYSSTTFLLLTIASQVFTAPQFITFKEGKVGVNFGGYHAAAGLGGLLGNGGAGGLFAEAGTPHGQAAMAGLGGGSTSGGSGGGLYAGATAGGNVKAAAGLAGGTNSEKSGGVGFAGASAGNRNAAAGLGGESGAQGSSGFTYSSSKSFGVSPGANEHVQPIQTNNKVHTEFNFDAASPVVPLSNTIVKSKTKVKEVHVEQPTVVVEKHYVQPEPVVVEKHIYHQQPVVFEKHIHHKKPHRIHNKLSVHGYINGAGLPPPPSIEKRIDVGVDSYANAGSNAGISHDGSDQVSYTKQVNFQRNPQFFADIFNIPISTLKAVGNFLGNTAGSTSVSVQKSASVQAGADSDLISPKHGQSSDSSKQTQLSIQTPDASKFIDDIFAIPINTLGAVNKFLENNVPARKKVQVDGVDEPTRFRGGRHARRRVNKTVVVEPPPASTVEELKEAETQ